MAERRSVNTLTIDGATVRIVFAQEDNAQVARSVRETLKESYNRQLEKNDGECLSA